MLFVLEDKFDDAIIRYIRREYNLLIGERTTEEVKIHIGNAFPPSNGEDKTIGKRQRPSDGASSNHQVTSQKPG